MTPRGPTMALLLSLLLMTSGCPEDADDDSCDAGDDDATPIAYACTEPVAIQSVNTDDSEMSPSLSGDGLSLFFSSDRPGGYGSSDIWMATRDSLDAEWSEPANLGPPVNTDFGQNNPAISADGSLLVFGDRTEGDYDLWIAEADGDGWSEPHRLDSLASSAKENKPAFSWDGQHLYFKRSDETLVSNIWVSARVEGAWAEAELVEGLNDGRAQTDPAPSPGGDVLFFAEGDDTASLFDLFFALRDGDGWVAAGELEGANKPGSKDEAVTVGPDGREFMMVSDRDDPEDRDIYTFTCERSE